MTGRSGRHAGGGNSVLIASLQAGYNNFLSGSKILAIAIEQRKKSEQSNSYSVKKMLISRGDIMFESSEKKRQRQNFNITVWKKLISSVLCRVSKKMFMKYRPLEEKLLYQLEYLNNQLKCGVNCKGRIRIRNTYDQLTYQLRLSVVAIKCTVTLLMNKCKIKTADLFLNKHGKIQYCTVVDGIKRLHFIKMYIVISKKKILEPGKVSFGKKECFAKSKSKAIKAWDMLAV